MQLLLHFLWQLGQSLGWNGLGCIAAIISTITTIIATFVLPSKPTKHAHTLPLSQIYPPIQVTSRNKRRKRSHR